MLVRKIKNDKIVLTHILLGAAAFSCQLNAYTMSGARRLVGTDWLDCLIISKDLNWKLIFPLRAMTRKRIADSVYAGRVGH